MNFLIYFDKIDIILSNKLYNEITCKKHGYYYQNMIIILSY